MTRARDLARFANNQALSVDGDLEVGINSTSPAARLDVRGDVVITGVLTATSFSGGISGNIVATAATVGSAVTINSSGIDATGVITATSFSGDGSNLTGVSGFATALSSSQSSPLFNVFKTPDTLTIGGGTSVSVESDTTSGNIAFMRNSRVHVATGATFHVGSGTTLLTNVLNIF